MIIPKLLNQLSLHSCWRISARSVHKKRYISVREFYKDRNILVTGCTGFVGQALVEKLLRSCPDIGNIYIPIRAKKSQDINQRYQQFLNNEVFNTLRNNQTTFADKLVPLSATLEDSNLGLSSEQIEKLTNEVSIIFHVAALIKFNPPLREAISSNVLISTNVFRFGKQCKNLAAYVYVSSLYTNIDLDYVEEKIYPTSWNSNQLIELMNQKELKKYTKEIVGTSPGSYFATKKVAEYLTMSEGASSPVAAVRLGKVSPSMKEPFPGWGFGSASYLPVMSLIEKGDVNRSCYVNPDIKEELIPCDLCSNSLITAAWYLGTNQAGIQHVRIPMVTHVQSNPVKNITSKELLDIVNRFLQEDGRSYEITAEPSKFKWALKAVVPTFFQTVRAYVTGEKPMSLYFTLFCLTNYGSKRIQLHNNQKEYRNLDKIENSLSDGDKKDFSADIKLVCWEEYIKTWLTTLKEKRLAREIKKRKKVEK